MDGITPEAHHVKQQLERDLNACWNLINNLTNRLNNQHLEIASLCKQIAAYETKN
jgi:hypothetical protein